MRARTRRVAITALALVAALLTVTVVMFKRRGEDSPRYVERNPAHRVARAENLREPVAAASPDGPPAWLLEPGIAARRIAGVVLADGERLPGATVSLRSEVFTSQGLAPPTQTTNEAGRFDFGEQLPSTYAAVASAAGHRPGVAVVNLRDPDQHPRPTELEIELAECESRGFGRVRDARGQPVVGATVSANGKLDEFSWFQPVYEVRTQGDGSFSICSTERTLLWVAANGYGSVWLRGDMPRDGWDVTLLGDGKVDGIVLSSTSEPISGARVVLMPSTGNPFSPPIAQTSFTAPDGTFAMAGLIPGTYEAAADHRGYATRWPWSTVTVRAGAVVHDVIIEMDSCRSLAGVVFEGSRPLAGAHVGHGAITQDDGSFVIPCTLYESFEFAVEKHDVLNPTVPAGTENIDDLVIRVRSRASLSGRVTADGVPVQKAVVAVGNPTGAVGMTAVFGEHYRTTSGEHGEYELVGLPAGSHEINAWDPDSERRSRPTIVKVSRGQQIADLDLELASAGVVKGVVLDRDGSPVPNVSVELIGGTQAKKRSLMEFAESQFKDKTNERGEFEIRGLAVATYRLCLDGCRRGEPGAPYLPLEGDSWPPLLVPRSNAVVELRLVIRGRTGLSISGQVVYSSSGAPCPFAAVRASYDHALALTDSSGNFALTDLHEGDYTIEAAAQDGSPGRVKDVAAGTSDVTITVEQTGTLQGVITGGEGECAVEAARTGGDPQEAAGTSSERQVAASVREFRFAGISPGEYQVQAVCGDGVAASQVTVPPGETVSITMTAGQGGEVRGVVRLFPSDNPAGDLECSLAGVSAHTEADDSFHLDQVPPGEGHVSCGKWSTNLTTSGSARVEVKENRLADVEVFVVAETPFVKRTELPSIGAQLRPDEAASPTALRFTAVAAAGPAARAGARVGDLVLAIDGGDARGSRADAALSYLMAQTPGTTVSLSVRRGEDNIDISLTMGSLDPRSGRGATRAPADR